MNKMINFDDESRAVEIVLAGETFVIKRITVKMRADHAEIEQLKYSYSKQLQELKDQELTGNKDDGKKFIELAVQASSVFAQVKYEKTMKLLELITSKNGYFITTEWWEDNCDFSQLERFILECINKDDSGEVKKKT